MIYFRHDDGESYDLRNVGNGLTIYKVLLSTNRNYIGVNNGYSLQSVIDSVTYL